MAQLSFYSDWDGYTCYIRSCRRRFQRAAFIRSNPPWKYDAVAHFFCVPTFFVPVPATLSSSPCKLRKYSSATAKFRKQTRLHHQRHGRETTFDSRRVLRFINSSHFSNNICKVFSRIKIILEYFRTATLILRF